MSPRSFAPQRACRACCSEAVTSSWRRTCILCTIYYTLHAIDYRLYTIYNSILYYTILYCTTLYYYHAILILHYNYTYTIPYQRRRTCSSPSRSTRTCVTRPWGGSANWPASISTIVAFAASSSWTLSRAASLPSTREKTSAAPRPATSSGSAATME